MAEMYTLLTQTPRSMTSLACRDHCAPCRVFSKFRIFSSTVSFLSFHFLVPILGYHCPPPGNRYVSISVNIASDDIVDDVNTRIQGEAGIRGHRLIYENSGGKAYGFSRVPVSNRRKKMRLGEYKLLRVKHDKSQK